MLHLLKKPIIIKYLKRYYLSYVYYNLFIFDNINTKFFIKILIYVNILNLLCILKIIFYLLLSRVKLALNYLLKFYQSFYIKQC